MARLKRATSRAAMPAQSPTPTPDALDREAPEKQAAPSRSAGALRGSREERPIIQLIVRSFCSRFLLFFLLKASQSRMERTMVIEFKSENGSDNQSSTTTATAK